MFYLKIMKIMLEIENTLLIVCTIACCLEQCNFKFMLFIKVLVQIDRSERHFYFSPFRFQSTNLKKENQKIDFKVGKLYVKVHIISMFT